MLLQEHPDARCPYCGSSLWYGLKTEPTGWKVQYECPRPDGCDRQFRGGWIPRQGVGSVDEAHERAQRLSGPS